MRQDKFSESAIGVYRAALIDFHEWRGEKLVFQIKKSHHQSNYIGDEIVKQLFEAAKDVPLDSLILRLMSDAGLRREEVVNLSVGNVGEKALRFRGKGDKDRTVPMTAELGTAIRPFCIGKGQNDRVIGLKQTAVYRRIKIYAAKIGRPEIIPHDFRHFFATRLLESGASIREVQELLGHADLRTTQVYLEVSGAHLEQAIGRLDSPVKEKIRLDKLAELKEIARKLVTDLKEGSESSGEDETGEQNLEKKKNDRALYEDEISAASVDSIVHWNNNRSVEKIKYRGRNAEEWGHFEAVKEAIIHLSKLIMGILNSQHNRNFFCHAHRILPNFCHNPVNRMLI